MSAAVLYAAFLRRTLQVGNRAPVGDPYLLRRDVALGVRIVEHITRQNGSVGHQRPALFGVPVGLATVYSYGCPLERGRIQVRQVRIQFVPDQEVAIGKNYGW